MNLLRNNVVDKIFNIGIIKMKFKSQRTSFVIQEISLSELIIITFLKFILLIKRRITRLNEIKFKMGLESALNFLFEFK